MAGEHIYGVSNQFQSLDGSRRVGFQQEISEPVEVSESRRRVGYPRQRFGFGFGGFLPAARALI